MYCNPPEMIQPRAADHCSGNMGCGTGLECIVCQLCGPCDQESGKRHTSDKKSGREHTVRYDELQKTQDKLLKSAKVFKTIMGKRERSLGERRVREAASHGEVRDIGERHCALQYTA